MKPFLLIEKSINTTGGKCCLTHFASPSINVNPEEAEGFDRKRQFFHNKTLWRRMVTDSQAERNEDESRRFSTLRLSR
jgi:hypothetical protein